jgi:hypothetical protein
MSSIMHFDRTTHGFYAGCMEILPLTDFASKRVPVRQPLSELDPNAGHGTAQLKLGWHQQQVLWGRL